jgi:hypothetical protein
MPITLKTNKQTTNRGKSMKLDEHGMAWIGINRLLLLCLLYHEGVPQWNDRMLAQVHPSSIGPNSQL